MKSFTTICNDLITESTVYLEYAGKKVFLTNHAVVRDLERLDQNEKTKGNIVNIVKREINTLIQGGHTTGDYLIFSKLHRL